MLTQDRQIDRRILLEADSLEAMGWTVRIIAMPLDQPGAGTEDPRVIRIGQGPGGPALPRKEGVVLAIYRAARARLPMNSGPMRLLKRLAWRYVVRQDSFFLRLFEPTVLAHPADVYVAHDLPMLPVGVRAKQRHAARLVYDSHELYAEQEFSAREQHAWKRVEASNIGEADAVITVNPSIARELEQRYRLSRVHVLYNAEKAREAAVGDKRFHQVFGLPAQARVLLFQGGLSAGRHIEALVRAMRRVRSSHVHLVVLGDGGIKPQLERIVATGLSARVHLHDAVPQSELLAWSAAADAGIIPYQATCLNNYYCTPNKLFEFIAAGIPVLASDLPEIRAIVEGHGIGRVADMADEERIAVAIDAFFSDPGALRQWQLAATRAREVVNWDVEGRKLVEIFKALS
ncbi:glycosyltransferase [Ramlibacter rhizophilus]|nr:glycosyltransferase [Ramlibacter rhizophilus]